MDFGLVLQNIPPVWQVIDYARRAEIAGFDNVWCFDSHLLWQESNVIFSQMLSQTHRITVGPMVTNPITRDPTVTASTFATLNTMFGNRTAIGIGRGDSAVRVLNGAPAKVAELAAAVTDIRHLANGGTVARGDTTIRLPWAPGSRVPVYVAAYGPKMLELAGRLGDGVILQIGDPHVVRWAIGRVRSAATAADRDPDSLQYIVAAPAYTGADRQHQLEQCRWFGAMVGNHVADIVSRYGTGSDVPPELTDYIAGRTSYDYNRHGAAGNPSADFVPDEIVARFCVLGEPADHIAKLQELQALGATQFAVYLQHDGKEQTLLDYQEKIIPVINPRGDTRT